MINGDEMQRLQRGALREIMQAITRSSHDGGAVNRASRDAIVREGVYTYVYHVGNPPTVYGRRYAGGGLADDKNLITTTIGGGTTVTIDIEDKTPAGDAGMINPPPDPVFYLSDIVESGANGPKWRDPDHPGPRPYMEESLRDGCRNGGMIDDALNDLLEHLVIRS